ncbi:MAG TPA: DUF4268 domain-containing protein [Chitinophagaceae bacterium]|jgi:hypothetical protein|nr:DUF4268 domain-containing protein [Chitinophagaceae bacterium]
MYTRQEVSQTRQRFWTTFGQYMWPVKGATGDTVNWLNYKTGIRHIYFRMDAGPEGASVAIELQHPDIALRHHYFEQLIRLKTLLENATGEKWDWEQDQKDESGRLISRTGIRLNGITILQDSDWPAIISFLKPRIIALDQFWSEVKDGFE